MIALVLITLGLIVLIGVIAYCAVVSIARWYTDRRRSKLTAAKFLRVKSKAR